MSFRPVWRAGRACRAGWPCMPGHCRGPSGRPESQGPRTASAGHAEGRLAEAGRPSVRKLCCAKTRSVRVTTTPARHDRHGRTTSNESGADGDKRHRVETGERQAGRRCCHGRCRLAHDFAEHGDRYDRRSNRGLRGDGRRGRIRSRHRNAGAQYCSGACHAPHDKCPSYVLHFVPPRNTAPMNSHLHTATKLLRVVRNRQSSVRLSSARRSVSHVALNARGNFRRLRLGQNLGDFGRSGARH